ncbi:MAG TPA: Hsp20/alpha crystallin family protein [Kofleriaceae bacterium]|nr:Hsp20/alpha crystallin family protein [Kofleriaceae bacterium]
MTRNNTEQALIKPEVDPFRWMREMMRWDPFQPATVPTFFGPGYERTFTPAFEVKETKDAYLIKADLPGIKEADIDVKLTGDRLAITGKREAEREDKGDAYYAYERTYGDFQRTFVLPEGLDSDHVHAELKDGVLTIALPKLPGTETKTIAVKSGEKTKS